MKTPHCSVATYGQPLVKVSIVWNNNHLGIIPSVKCTFLDLIFESLFQLNINLELRNTYDAALNYHQEKSKGGSMV